MKPTGKSLAEIKAQIAEEKLREAVDEIGRQHQRRIVQLEKEVAWLKDSRTSDRFVFLSAILIVSTFWWGCGHMVGWGKGEAAAQKKYAAKEITQQP